MTKKDNTSPKSKKNDLSQAVAEAMGSSTIALPDEAEMAKYGGQNPTKKPAENPIYLWFSPTEADRYHQQLKDQLQMSLPAGTDLNKHMKNMPVMVQVTPTTDGQTSAEPIGLEVGQDFQSYDLATHKDTGEFIQFTAVTATPTPPKHYDDYMLMAQGNSSDFAQLIAGGHFTNNMNFLGGGTPESNLVALEQLKTQIPDFYEPWIGYINTPEPKLADTDAEADIYAGLDQKIGMDTQKNQVREMVALAELSAAERELGIAKTCDDTPMLHMVLTGNAGTGKTEFAREYAKILYKLGFTHSDKLVECSKEDVTSGYIGQTPMVMKDKIRDASGGVLFIDEAYTLFEDKDSGSAKGYGKEALNTLLKAMEDQRHNLVVIMAGYSKEMKDLITESNSGLLSRVAVSEFKDYSVDELGDIMQKMLADRGQNITDDAFACAKEKLAEYKKTCPKHVFGNGRTVRNMIEHAKRKLALRLKAEGGVKAAFSSSTKTRAEAAKTLTTLTIDDIQTLNLNKLSNEEALEQAQKGPYDGTEGFGFARATIVQNKTAKMG